MYFKTAEPPAPPAETIGGQDSEPEGKVPHRESTQTHRQAGRKKGGNGFVGSFV